MQQEGYQKNKYLYLLSDISDVVSGALADKDILDSVLWEIGNAIGLDACWIQKFNASTNSLVLIVQHGLPESLLKELESVQVGINTIGRVALDRKTIYCNDLNNDPNYNWDAAAKAGFLSLIASPVISSGQLVGLICGLSTKPNLFTLNEIKLMSAVCSCVSDVCCRACLDHAQVEVGKQQDEIKHTHLFLSALSHELKTPLTAIIASTGLLIEELEKKQESSLLRMAQNISRGAASLQNRLNELINLSKNKEETFGISKKEFDFSHLAAQVADQVLSLVKQKNQTLNLDVTPYIKIHADDQRIEQVLLNLLSNAIKFTPEGGQIFLKVHKDEKGLVVNVQDNGPGIPTEERKKLFVPYYHPSADRSGMPGLGLGLAISKQIVELHGGAIWVESDVGEGSTFSFSLPLSEK